MAYRLTGTDTLIESGTQLVEEDCRFTLSIIQQRLPQAGIHLAFTPNDTFR